MFGIAELTFRKIKEPSFLIMLVFAVLLGAVVSDISSLAEQMSGSILEQLINRPTGCHLFTSTLFAFAITALLAIFAGSTDIPRDIDSGMVMLLLSKPVGKAGYLMGKYLGILALCTLFFTVAEASIVVGHWLMTGEWHQFKAVVRQFYMLFALLPMVAITVMFSCFLSDLSSMIVTAVYMFLSLSVSAVPLLVAVLPKSLGVNIYLYMFYFFFPNVLYYFQTMDLFGVTALSMAVYSVSMSAIFLCIGVLRLNQRDFV